MKRTPSGTRPRGHIVLIVDDDSEVRSTLAMLIASAGFGVLESADGTEGLIAARAVRPDVILLDLSLPDWDGFEVARRLRSDRRTRSIPLIALTGSNVDAPSLSDLGFSGLLTKPCLPEVLFELLHAVFSRTGRRHTA